MIRDGWPQHHLQHPTNTDVRNRLATHAHKHKKNEETNDALVLVQQFLPQCNGIVHSPDVLQQVQRFATATDSTPIVVVVVVVVVDEAKWWCGEKRKKKEPQRAQQWQPCPTATAAATTKTWLAVKTATGTTPHHTTPLHPG